MEIGIALGLKGAISCIFGSLLKDDCNIKDEIIDISKHISDKMNKINKVRKGEVRIYKGMTYVAVPEIKEDHCTGCCFYNEGSCLIRDPDHVDFPDCHDIRIVSVMCVTLLHNILC